MANKKENSKNLVKRMFLSISIMSFFVSAGIENVNAMNENIFEAIKKGRSDNKSRRNAAPDSSISDQKTNTGVDGNSLIIKDLNKDLDANYDKNESILDSLGDEGVIKIPINISKIIKNINTVELCSKDMLSLCSFVCMNGYEWNPRYFKQ